MKGRKAILMLIALSLFGVPRRAMEQTTSVPTVHGVCAIPPGEMFQVPCPNSGRTVSVEANCDESVVNSEVVRACGLNSSSSSSAAANTQQMMYNAVANEYMQAASELGAALGEKLNQWAQHAKEKQQMEVYREAQEEMARVRAERAREAAWQREMADLNQQLVGPKPPEGGLTFKDMGTNFFGEGGGGRVLHFAALPDSSVGKSFTSPAAQARIARCLSKMAAEPGRSPADAKFLSRQAALALSGQPVQVDTSGCQAATPTPPAPPPPPVQAKAPPLPASAQTEASPAPLSPVQVTFYTRLFEATNRNAVRTVEVAKEISRLEQALVTDEQAIQAKRRLMKAAVATAKQGAGPTAPPTAASATRMAAICNQRAHLTRRQAELAQSVKDEYFALRDLQQSFQTAAANSTYWGDLYGTVHQDDVKVNEALDKLDPLATVLGHAKVPNPEAPGEAVELPLHLNELDTYLHIARVTAQSADAITGFIASGKVHGIDAETTDNLRTLRSLSANFASHLKGLRDVSSTLAGVPACDSSQLVVPMESAAAAPSPSNPLAQAQAALQQAEQAKDNDEKALSGAQSQMKDLRRKLQGAQNCFHQAQSDPAKAGTLMQSCVQ